MFSQSKLAVLFDQTPSNKWILFSADTSTNDLTSKPLTGLKKCEAVPLLIDYCLFQAEHGFCQISLKRTVLPVSLPAKPREGISAAMISRIEAFSMLQHRAQQAEHPVAANTRPPIACVADATPQVYESRRPERTVPYQLIQPHAKSWLAQAEAKGDSIPRYIEKGFSRFMDCGIFAKGFARVRCDACGNDFLVAFSCKVRGICPSCSTRQMVFIAAHLVEHVYPIAPVRQWVLSVPKRLRYFLHRDHDLERRVLQVFLRVIERVLRQHSLGVPVEPDVYCKKAISESFIVGSTLAWRLSNGISVVSNIGILPNKWEVS